MSNTERQPTCHTDDDDRASYAEGGQFGDRAPYPILNTATDAAMW
jgi:hypothetical protein